MVSLFYHLETDYSDYDAKFFVYIINQLTEVMEKVCPVSFGDARSIYHRIARKHAKFAKKGLKAPPEVFRTARRGYVLHNSIFLICDNEVEYYWYHNPEEALQSIIDGGREYLLKLCRL